MPLSIVSLTNTRPGFKPKPQRKNEIILKAFTPQALNLLSLKPQTRWDPFESRYEILSYGVYGLMCNRVLLRVS